MLFVSRNNKTSKFIEWASKTLFAVQMGTEEQKNKLVSTIKDVSYESIQELTKTIRDKRNRYTIDITTINGNKYNTIVQAYTVNVNPGANPVAVSFGQGAKTTLTYSDIIPSYVEGYFGQQTVAIPLDTAKLDIFNNFQASNFILNGATLNFKILNEFGAEFSSSLFNVKAINSSNSNTVALTTGLLSNININAASKSGLTVFPSVKTVSLNGTNSNIAPFLSNLPDKLKYQGNINVYP
jgi:hypothetical protein